MKGGLAAMMCALKDVERQTAVRVRLVCVPDEESEEIDERSTDGVVSRGLGGDFAITGEPTNLHIGVEAKGVLAMMIEVHGRAAHSSTPWLGDNAVLKAVDVFRAIESLPFSRESSEMFDRPSINLGRIEGGDALNKVPDRCRMAVDIRFLPGQDPEEIMAQIARIPDVEVTKTFIFPPVSVPREQPVRAGAARRGGPRHPRQGGHERRARRRLGRRCVHGGGHPGGRVRARRRRATTAPRSGCRSPRWPATGARWSSFVRMLPIWLERPAPEAAVAGDAGEVAAEEPRSGLTAIEGGRA